jgi:multimeric flavodoxin WrbA
MQVLAFNGSPRKEGNTGKLLREALRGAADSGATTTFIQISNLNLKGCRGCYGCKKKASYGKCVQKDDMTDLYPLIDNADAVLFGSPVYMGAMTPELKMVLDRLFPYLTMDFGSLLPKGISGPKRSGLIFTQNQKDAGLFSWHFNTTAMMLGHLGFANAGIVVGANTIGHESFEKLVGDSVPNQYAEKKDELAITWPQTMEGAYLLGRKLTQQT